jgi:hypothetical protein
MTHRKLLAYGDEVTLPVTAKAGTTLTFLCAIHPWMQAKLKVVK